MTGDVDESPEAAPRARERALERGASVGRHVVLHELGKGGMGVVHAAYDPELDRMIALKLLRPDRSGDGRARLLREAQALAKLAHPNVVAIHDVGTLGDRVWLAMELVRGQTLRRWLEVERGWREVLRVMRGAGEGLAAAHAAGLLHRDFKPDNVMVGDDGRVRVMDFGLARAHGPDSRDDEPSRPHPTTETLAMEITRAGSIVGTPAYMAPERFRDADVTAAADQFGFCVTLWQALYGELPFAGRTLVELAADVTAGRRRAPPKDRRVPGRLRRACERGLQADPKDRWPSMQALLEELARIGTPRRRGLVTLGIAGGLVAIGGGIARYAEVGFRCQGAQAQLEGVWDEARRREVEAALLGTGLAYAPDTWARVEPSLDAYAHDWVEARSEACEATSVRQEQSVEAMDLRMECLRVRKVALREAVGVLAQADAARVEHAVELVASLPSLSRCDDVEALRAELPPPEDPTTASEVQALRERLALARALRLAGLHERGELQTKAVVDEAEALGYAPLSAEARLERARASEALARYPQAEADAEQAYLAALELGHTVVATEAASTLAVLAGERRARHELGLQWGRTALALAKARPFEPELQAHALHVIGNVLGAQGEVDEALEHHRRALDIGERALGSEHVSIASSLNNSGSLLQRQGRLDEALEHHRRALAIREQALGARHPSVAQSLTNIGIVLDEQGRLDEALAHHERALAIREQALDPGHPGIAATLNNIASLLRQRGELDRALAHMRRAVAILEQALGEDHPDVAGMLDNMGALRLEQGKPDEALPLHRRALATFERALGEDHPQVAVTLVNIGDALAMRGELEEARTSHERALSIFERALGPDDMHLAYPLEALAELALDRGELDQAQAYAGRALALAEKLAGPGDPDLAGAAMAVAHVALAQGDPARAREQAERVRAILEAADAWPSLLAQARFVVARTLPPGERARALELARQARDAHAELGPLEAERLAEVRAWLAEHAADE